MLVIVIRCAVLRMWSFPLTCPLPIKLMSSPNFSIHVYLTCIWQDCVKRWDWELSVSTWEELGRAEGKWLWLPLTYVTGNMQTCQLCVRASEAAVWLMFEGCAHVHADVAWLSFVKFQTCEFEAHCELKIALKKKTVCLSSKQGLLAYYPSRKRPLDIFNLSCSDSRWRFWCLKS